MRFHQTVRSIYGQPRKWRFDLTSDCSFKLWKIKQIMFGSSLRLSIQTIKRLLTLPQTVRSSYEGLNFFCEGPSDCSSELSVVKKLMFSDSIRLLVKVIIHKLTFWISPWLSIQVMDIPKIDVLRFPQTVCPSYGLSKNWHFEIPSNCQWEFDRIKKLHIDESSDCPCKFTFCFAIKQLTFWAIFSLAVQMFCNPEKSKSIYTLLRGYYSNRHLYMFDIIAFFSYLNMFVMPSREKDNI